MNTENADQDHQIVDGEPPQINPSSVAAIVIPWILDSNDDDIIRNDPIWLPGEIRSSA